MAYEFVKTSSQYISAQLGAAVSEPCTIALWFNTTDGASSPMLMSICTVTSNNRKQVNVTDGTYKVTASAIAGGVAGDATTTAGGSSGINAAASGVFTSSSSRTAYVNGGSSGTNTASVTTGNTAYIGIAARHNGTSWGAFPSAKLAETAIWSVDLTADEITSLSKGFSPRRIRPQSLVFYAPLLRDLTDIKGALTLTNNNSATVADHPRVY